MTLKRFEQLLQKANPRLRIADRAYGDILGLYFGPHYILRMTKGELQMNGYRYQIIDRNNVTQYINGNIQKRGRKHILNILWNHRHITYKQRSQILWGIKSR